jgi:hypothetical protein
MLEAYALQTSQYILASLVNRIVAALRWFGAHSDRIGSTTQQATNSERREGTR